MESPSRCYKDTTNQDFLRMELELLSQGWSHEVDRPFDQPFELHIGKEAVGGFRLDSVDHYDLDALVEIFYLGQKDNYDDFLGDYAIIDHVDYPEARGQSGPSRRYKLVSESNLPRILFSVHEDLKGQVIALLTALSKHQLTSKNYVQNYFKASCLKAGIDEELSFNMFDNEGPK